MLSESSPLLTARIATADQVTVPDISGVSPGAAGTILRSAGLALGVRTGVSPTIDCSLLGLIVSQSPEGGSQVPAGSPVNYRTAVLARGHSCE